MSDKEYSSFAGDVDLDIEIEHFTIEVPVSTEKFPYKIHIGEPVWLFPTIKNPERRWWQFWKPTRVVHPVWQDFYDYARRERAHQ